MEELLTLLIDYEQELFLLAIKYKKGKCNRHFISSTVAYNPTHMVYYDYNR